MGSLLIFFVIFTSSLDKDVEAPMIMIKTKVFKVTAGGSLLLLSQPP